jgi:cystathionine gamma-synthase
VSPSHAESRPLRPATIAVHGGRPTRSPGAPVNTPISLSSTYYAAPEGEEANFSYARESHENSVALEEVLGELEGGTATLFASGMGAISAALSLVPHGGAILSSAIGYSGTVSALQRGHESGRLESRIVDMRDLDAVRAAAQGASMIWIETPANPTLDITDIAAITTIAQEHGAITVADSTFSTPLITRPLELDVDIVIHSVTKWIAGHSDLLMGAAITADTYLHDALRLARVSGGAIAAPFEAWLALRGLRTLPLRLKTSCENAATLAERLINHPKVARVRYPGLPSHPQHQIALAQMNGLFGAIVSIELTGGVEAAQKLCSTVEVWTAGTSVGGVESLIERRRRWGFESKETPEELIRLSVGIEDVEDLWADLERALTLL